MKRSWFNDETGEIHLKKLNVNVNNFNDITSLALRCNNDLEFILSGPATKSIVEYSSDYLTKSSLNAYLTYASLECGIQKLENYNSENDSLEFREKHMLQRCSYTMLSHQELSAQQVMSYICDYEDHFTSHKFRNLYWQPFENLIEKQWPSPECDVN